MYSFDGSPLLFPFKEEHARLNITGKRGDSHTVQATWSKDDLYKLDLVSNF